MSQTSHLQPSGPRPWSTLAHHDWEDDTELLTRLAEALEALPTGDDDPLLQEHVEVGPLLNGLASATPQRQFTEVRFEVDRYELRITQDGTIAARER